MWFQGIKRNRNNSREFKGGQLKARIMEWTDMYAEFAKVAEEEGFTELWLNLRQ